MSSYLSIFLSYDVNCFQISCEINVIDIPTSGSNKVLHQSSGVRTEAVTRFPGFQKLGNLQMTTWISIKLVSLILYLSLKMISKMHQSLDVRIFRLLRQVVSCKQGLDRIKDFPDTLPSLWRVNSADQTEGEDNPGQVVRVASKTFETFHQSKYKTD